MIIHLHFPLRGEFYPLDFQTFGLQYHGQFLSAFAFFAFPLIIGVTMAFFRMQFVKFNNRFFNLKVWLIYQGYDGYGFSSSTMKFYTLPSFSQHDQCEFLTLPSFVQHSQKFLFTIVIQHTWFLHNYMWVFNITLFCPAFPNSFCLFTTTWLKGWKRR